MNKLDLFRERKDLLLPLRLALAALIAIVCAATALPPVAALVLCLIGFLLAGYELILDYAGDLKAKHFLSERLLMLLAAVCCFLAGRCPEAVLAAILFCAARFLAEKLKKASLAAVSARGGHYDEEKKAQIPDVADSILRFAIPVVILLALVMALLPLVFQQDPAPWIGRAAILLFALCPCAPLLALRLSTLRGAGLAAEKGAILESEDCADRIASVNSVVFDGIETASERLGVDKLLPVDGLSEENFLMLAAYPLSVANDEKAAAVFADCGLQPVGEAAVMGETLPGLGSLAHAKGLVISAGNLSMMERLGLLEAASSLSDSPDALHVAVGEHYAGCILLKRVRLPLENNPVESLKDLGLGRLILFSTEEAEQARRSAAQLGVDEVLTAADEEEKILALEKLLAESFPEETLLYYGSDPALLQRADIGCAAPGAERAGSAYVLEDKPGTLRAMLRFGKQARAIGRQGFYGAVALKLLLLIGCMAGLLPFFCAVIADSGLALLAACNVLRLKGRK